MKRLEENMLLERSLGFSIRHVGVDQLQSVDISLKGFLIAIIVSQHLAIDFDVFSRYISC